MHSSRMCTAHSGGYHKMPVSVGWGVHQKAKTEGHFQPEGHCQPESHPPRLMEADPPPGGKVSSGKNTRPDRKWHHTPTLKGTWDQTGSDIILPPSHEQND